MFGGWKQLDLDIDIETVKFSKGDRVRLMGTDRQGLVVEVTPTLIEVRQDGGTETYLWGKHAVTKIWSVSPDDECTCESLDLFRYGCRCGYFERENK